MLIAVVALRRLQRTPWGRVLTGIREDEDAVRALGKNVFSYKLQSLAIASALAAIAGYFLALNVTVIYPLRVRLQLHIPRLHHSDLWRYG